MDLTLTLFLIIHRMVAGIQNGHGYGKNLTGRRQATWALTGYAGAATLVLILTDPPVQWLFIGGLICILAAVASTWAIDMIFAKKLQGKWADIHFWEMAKTGGIVLAVAASGFNLIAIACSIYPGLILHKGMVNINSGLRWWYTGTDDETGKTFRIPLLNITIPRSSNAVRISLAAASLIIAVLASIYGWSLNLWN